MITVLWQFSLVYMNESVIFSRYLLVYARRISEIPSIPNNVSVTVNTITASFMQKPLTIRVTLSVLDASRLLHTTGAIRRLQEPTNLEDLRFFQGKIDVYWLFVSIFARLAALLNIRRWQNKPKKLRLSNKKLWTAINTQIKTLVSPPFLALPNDTGHMMLDTEGCDNQVWCVVFQKTENETM